VPPNLMVAAALYDKRFAQAKGNGACVMCAICERAGLSPPLFDSDRWTAQFMLRLFFHHSLES